MLLNGTITGLIMGGILSLPVLGVAVIYGITGIPNFAIGVIGVFGGFITWYFLSFSMGLAIVIGIVVCFAIGYIIQTVLLTPISEKGGDATLFFIITISLGFVFEGMIRAIFPKSRRGWRGGFQNLCTCLCARDSRHHTSSGRAH
jgi:branched-chain amino acid transport system permease protein